MLFKTKELVEIIKKNKKDHWSFFEQACDAYKAAVIVELEKALESAKKGKKPNAHYMFVQPVEHMKDYDRIIKMLELTTQKTIELDEQDFGQYVLDDWSWKREFLATNSTYMGGR